MKILEEKGYKYQKHISTGGEGEIHLVKSVNKLFVAKIFPRLEESSFKLIESLKNMRVPNLPIIHELFNYEENTILIRDYIEGNTLYEVLEKNGSFDYITAKSFIMKICETLKYLHNIEPEPIIYRDLKPENIIVTPDNEIRVIDFGIARYYKKESTRDTILAGTKGYTAPEVLAGMQSDSRSDIYSVGLLFYEMLTGKNLLIPPFQVRPVKESNFSLGKWLDIIIAKATDFNQTNRYSSIEEFIYDLEHPHKVYRRKIKKIFNIISVAAVVLSALLLALYFIFPFDNLTDSSQYEILLELDFEDKSDWDYIYGIEELNSEYSFLNDKLIVEKEICSVDYNFTKGQIVHYSVRGSEFASVGAGAYSINMSAHLDCLFYDQPKNLDLGIFNVPLEGDFIVTRGKFLDVLFYIPEDKNAFYVVVIDQTNNKIAYTGKRVPVKLNDMLTLDMMNFNYDEGGFLHVDTIKIIEGNFKQYLSDNFKAFKTHKKDIEDLLNSGADALPDLEIVPVNTIIQ